MMIRRCHAPVIAAALALAAPLAAQRAPDSPSIGDDARARAAAAARLLPAPCAACGFGVLDAEPAGVGDARLPRGVAPLIGTVVGAGVGLAAYYIWCGDGSCEMAGLFYPLAGALIGGILAGELERLLAERRW